MQVLSTGPTFEVSKMPIPDLSALSLQHDSDDDNSSSHYNSSKGDNFITPQKQPQHTNGEVNLESAIESNDLAALEGLGLKLALMARMGDIVGIRRMIEQSDSSRNPFGSSKGRDSFQGPSTSSSLFSTPETVVAAPTSPISPRLGLSSFSSRSLYGDRLLFSPYITSVKTAGQAISSDRVNFLKFRF